MNTKHLDLGERRIGAGEPCFIVAEAGVNHNGDVDLAMQLVDAARAAGADAVKFQTWITDRLVAASKIKPQGIRACFRPHRQSTAIPHGPFEHTQQFRADAPTGKIRVGIESFQTVVHNRA